MQLLLPELFFSYRQFFIYDPAVGNPACAWTDRHIKQGYARRPNTIAVATILEFGTATVQFGLDEDCDWKRYERVLAIPLQIESGRISIDGPEEYPISRELELPSGVYRAIIGQLVASEITEEILVVLEQSQSGNFSSEILQADNQLSPIYPLLETADRIEI